MTTDALAQYYPWLLVLCPLLPALAAAIGIIFGGLGLGRRTAWVTIGAMATVTLIAWFAVLFPVLGHWRAGGEAYYFSHDWTLTKVGAVPLIAGVMVDHLTAVMLAMVSLLVLLIEIYSVGYMATDPHYSRFHSYVSLFAAGMLGLVVSNNFLSLMVSWELMGLCSYLLIGFYYFKDSARKAAKKAFIVTRVGDLGFYVAMMVMFGGATSWRFDDVFAWAKVAPAALVVIAALGLFAASVGKSAQFPLHVWLPDAMEGPTPVSALIHAATMVSAGVYLVARAYPLFYGSTGHLEAELFGLVVRPLTVVAWIGGFTALFAATIAVVQTDIKKVLAYSTVSQLGYMFLGLGVGGWTAAVFHLITHAFFKALLFLGSGSVIHAVEHGLHAAHIEADPQHMGNMGGLAKKLPVTYWTFLIGTLALAGIFPFSGFFSKDEVLLETLFGLHGNLVLGAFGMAAAFLTAFYMARLMWLTFYGQPRHPAAFEQTHESPKTMTMPLAVIAVFAALLGLPALPAFFGGHNLVHDLLNLGSMVRWGVIEPAAHAPSLGLAMIATLVAVSGLVIGGWLWGTAAGGRVRAAVGGSAFGRAVLTPPRKLYWANEGLWALLVTPMFALAQACRWLDQWVIDLTVNAVGWLTLRFSALGRWLDHRVVDGAVRGVAQTAWTAGEVGKYAQDGRVQNYVLFGVTALAVLAIVAWRWWGGA